MSAGLAIMSLVMLPACARVSSSRLDGATVKLYPASGIVRDMVTNTNTAYDDNTLTWDANIEPGNWIVIVEGTDLDENGGGIAVGLLEASVQEGASIDLVMEKGGLISLSSSWLTFESVEFHAGDVVDDVVVEIDGVGIKWEMPFDSNGEVEMILPAEEVYRSTVNLRQFSTN